MPQLHLISACDRILASNAELLRRAERKIREYKGQETAEAILSSQQCVLDLVIYSAGSPDALDAARGKEFIDALFASARSEGRRSALAEGRVEIEEIQSTLDATKDDVEDRDRKIKEIATEKLRVDAEKKAREDEIERLTKERARIQKLIVDHIVDKSVYHGSFIINSFLALLVLFTIVGHFFVWQGTNWWFSSIWNFLLGIMTLSSSVLSLIAGIGFILSTNENLVAWAKRRTINKLIVLRLRVGGHSRNEDIKHAIRERGFLG